MNKNNDDKVSLRDVYEIVNEMNDKLDRRLQHDEDKIENIENFQNRALGILSVITFIISVSSSYVWDKILGRR